jgi:hypothetical protein
MLSGRAPVAVKEALKLLADPTLLAADRTKVVVELLIVEALRQKRRERAERQAYSLAAKEERESKQKAHEL